MLTLYSTGQFSVIVTFAIIVSYVELGGILLLSWLFAQLERNKNKKITQLLVFRKNIVLFRRKNIEKVEFYVDGLHRWTDTKAPYNWRWRLSSHIKHRHIISVIAYDDEGNTAIDECQVWKFF